MRVGAAYTQTGVLAKGRVKGSAGEIEELGRELELARASPPPKAGTRREAKIWAAQVGASPACGDHQGRLGRSAARGSLTKNPVSFVTFHANVGTLFIII